MFLPKRVLYEKDSANYYLGKKLLDYYKEKGIQCDIIENHNNIEEMRKKQNSEFKEIKQNLIIGIRKTHKFIENHKVSDYLVPYTSSGCIAMCLYCYLVCNFNKCSYLRLFVNREEMLNKIIKIANKSDKNLVFEIGSNSDLILENTITDNLVWTIETFSKSKKGMLTFPTKFGMVDPILNLNHNGKIIVRVSVNPEEIIKKIELGTSPLEERVKAINKLVEAGYKVGILIAPVIFLDSWEEKYENLIINLYEKLSSEVKKNVFFEIIFMTYSFVHRAINSEAFPDNENLYDKEKMTVRGRGRYMYKKEFTEIGKDFFQKQLKKYFPNNEIKYMV